MATDDSSLMAEVREQTELTDSTVLSQSRLAALLSNAKREIESDVGRSLDWYTETDAENALFWLVCLFAIDEGNTDTFAIGELRVDPEADSEKEHPWSVRYRRAVRHLLDSESLFGMRSVNRGPRADRPQVEDGDPE